MGGGDLPKEEPAPPARHSAEEARKPGEKREAERQMMMEEARRELRSRAVVTPAGTVGSSQGCEAEQRFLSGILGVAGPSSEQESGCGFSPADLEPTEGDKGCPGCHCSTQP